MDREHWRRREAEENVKNRFAQLKPVERQIMELVVAGKTNKMIAEELGISVRTVENRRARMMKKLRVESRADLLALATSDDLRSCPP